MTMPSPEVLADLWRQTLATDHHWCRRCEQHRVPAADALCPVCAGDRRR
jgi:hypothetical protein